MRIDINSESDRNRMFMDAQNLFDAISDKYNEYKVKEEPYIYVKADFGTYGMGVQALQSPKDILSLNRKMRNKLAKGKSASVINQFLLQEGVPTVQKIEGQTSEVCVYQIANEFVGAFYRMHPDKNDREKFKFEGYEFSKNLCRKRYG